MEHNSSVAAVAQVIQLAIAPVFLLTGIAGMLSVLSARLGRVTDRARSLERRLPHTVRQDQVDLLHAEIRPLWRRILMINWAIRLNVGSALTISLVIVTLFLGDYGVFAIDRAIAGLFIIAMLLIILALLLLLLEVGLATKKMGQGIEATLNESADQEPP